MPLAALTGSVIASALMVSTFLIIDGGPGLSWTVLGQAAWSCVSLPLFAAAAWRAKARRYDWVTNLSALGIGSSLAQALGSSLAVFFIGFSRDPSGVQCFNGGAGGTCAANGPDWYAFLAYLACAALGLAALGVSLGRRQTRQRAPSRKSRKTRRR